MKPKTLQVKIRASMAGKAGEEEEPVLLALPAEGAPAAQVLQRMRSRVLPRVSKPAVPQRCMHLGPNSAAVLAAMRRRAATTQVHLLGY